MVEGRQPSGGLLHRLVPGGDVHHEFVHVVVAGNRDVEAAALAQRSG
jgi:hypothetical protein